MDDLEAGLSDRPAAWHRIVGERTSAAHMVVKYRSSPSFSSHKKPIEMSAAWAKLETHVVDGVFPLRRCIGSSDHSGVFLTDSGNHAPSTVALKLVRFVPAEADMQLSRWLAAADLRILT